MGTAANGRKGSLGILIAMLVPALILACAPAQAADSRHTLSVSARVLGHCRLDSQAGAAKADAPGAADPRVSCSRNAARPSIEVTAGVAPAPQPMRLVEASPQAAAARPSTLVTVLY